MTVVNAKFGVGAPVRRLEDPALLTGQGRFVDDVAPDNCLHAYVLRSPVAHARFRLDGLKEARSAPGVHLVLTADDLDGLSPLLCTALAPQVDRSPIDVPPYDILCRDIVRHVGDALAFIVAETKLQARDASELIEFDFDDMDAVVDVDAALQSDAPCIWAGRETNLAFESGLGDPTATDEAFAGAHQVARLEIVNNRLVTNYMETRGIVAEYDADTDQFTATLGTQGVHNIRILLSRVMGIDKTQLRVITPDVGGGFGTKAVMYREYPLSLFAARALGRPVKWVGERTEHFLGCAQGRDNLATAELALDGEGHFLGLRIDLRANMGAYLSQLAPIVPWIGISMSTGVYDIPALHVRLRGVFTNTVPVDAYRGAGRPEAAYLIERLVDEAARVAGLDPREIRRRNFIQPEALPYKTQGGRTYDTGEFSAHLEQTCNGADWDGFTARREQSRAQGKYRGIGLATYVEACAFAGSEEAQIRLERGGNFTILIGTQSNGQGHATAYAQVAAAHFGLSPDRFRVVQGDTAQIRRGGGTGGSRSIPLGAVSVDEAGKALVEKLKTLASDMLEASVSDLDVSDGEIRIVGTDRSVSLAEIAAKAETPDELLGVGEFKQTDATYPNGTHVCEVEIDPATGHTEVLRYTIVDDFGVVVNPLLLAGQVHGGVVQGIGQALYEHVVYDETGQLLTASLMDYALPKAADLPMIDFETRNIPSTINAMGIKGAGEAGTIGACPAVMNAVIDALSDGCGITDFHMPATPGRVWEAIREATQ
ncbi:xanthine dehydrogenase family protein molybdopterin-binding subunit [Coralliovum pocilloporae]|uniref:xanthine dehydrogenase family protein molybdopterin-binding subunit n=1 Tax=Coralliovum pocilloporae TaxID=3066369 RepID=UPI003307AE64